MPVLRGAPDYHAFQAGGDAPPPIPLPRLSPDVHGPHGDAPRPDQPPPGLANAHFELGRLQEAAQAYREVIRLAPGEAEARFNLGLVYERQGMLDLAAREFEAASALRREWALPRMRLVRIRQGLPTVEAGHPPANAVTTPARQGR